LLTIHSNLEESSRLPIPKIPIRPLTRCSLLGFQSREDTLFF
jgi:hypothetical protein